MSKAIDTFNYKFPDGAFQWVPNRDGDIGSNMWRRSEQVRAVWERLQLQGWEPATVINLMPFKLRQQIASVGEIVVPPCEFGKIYTKTVIELPRIDVADLGGGKVSASEILPVTLAQEVCAKYLRQDPTPGVFWFKGVREPSAEEMDKAISARDAWMHEQYRRGISLWATKQDMTQISDNMRVAARHLHSLGVIQELPDWVVVTKPEQLTHSAECAQCGELNKKSAKVCKFCEFPLNLDWVYENRDDLVTKYSKLFKSYDSAKGFIAENYGLKPTETEPIKKNKLPSGATLSGKE